jgi:tetratricopeptide (TPR) repeat protein
MTDVEQNRVFVTIPDPGRARTLDEFTAGLRSLRVWAGEPSYNTVKNRVNEAWTAAGRPASELTTKATVVDCFKPGRRRLNTDLVIAVVEALHPDPVYVSQCRQALKVISGETQAAAQVRVQDILPEDLPGFTGRTAEIERLRRALRRATVDATGVEVAAIEGMAGVGKTQLAVHVGHLLLRERLFDRVLFVNLRGFDPDPAQPPADPAAVLHGFLRLLGMSGHQIPHDLDGRAAAYRALLSPGRVLVILDNAADTDQVLPLLPEAPECRVLITSRRILDDLQPALRLAVNVFTPTEALRFLSRVKPEIPVGDAPDAATRIAERCGRLPLALGLVAGHMRANPGWTLTDHAEWLDERHQSRRLDTGVELAFDLSYQHLSIDRQRLLRLLALHPGHDLEAYAAAALADTDLRTAEDQLNGLRSDHLLQPGAPGRYTFHDLIRAYAATLAHDHDRPSERRACLTRLFDHYLATAATAMNTLQPGERHRRPQVPPASTPGPDLSKPDVALCWLDAERLTLVAVAGQTAGHGWSTHSTRLSRTLFRYLDGGHHTDAVTVHGYAQHAARQSGDLLGEAHALTDLGTAHRRMGENGRAGEHLQRARDLFRQAGDETGEARTLSNLGDVETVSGRYPAAADYYSQAMIQFRKIGDETGEARTLSNLGDVEGRSGRYGTANDHYARALILFRGTGDQTGEAWTLNSLGCVETWSGRYGSADHHLQQALTLFRQLGDRTGEGFVLDSLGTLHTRLDRADQAAEYHRQALSIARDTGDRYSEVGALNGLGEAAHNAGRPEEALTHHAAAHTVAAEIGDREQQARARTGLGLGHYALGQPAPAREHYQHALNLYTDLGMLEADKIRTYLTDLENQT